MFLCAFSPAQPAELFLFFVSRLGFASYIPSGICVLFPVSGCFLVDQ